MACCSECGTEYAANKWMVILQPVLQAANTLHVAILRNLVNRVLALSTALAIPVRDENAARWTADGFDLLLLWSQGRWEERAFTSLVGDIEYALGRQVEEARGQFHTWEKCAEQFPDNIEIVALRDKHATEYKKYDTTRTILVTLNNTGRDSTPFHGDDLSLIREMRYYTTRGEFVDGMASNATRIHEALEYIAGAEDTDVITPKSVESVKPLLPLAVALIASIKVVKEQIGYVE